MCVFKDLENQILYLVLIPVPLVLSSVKMKMRLILTQNVPIPIQGPSSSTWPFRAFNNGTHLSLVTQEDPLSIRHFSQICY